MRFIIHDVTVDGPSRMHGPYNRREACANNAMFVRNVSAIWRHQGVHDEMEIQLDPDTGDVSIFHKGSLHRKLTIFSLDPGRITA